MIRENIFAKARRRIKQTFESLYWYRWRNDSEFILPSCWNGSSDLLNIMLAKLEHIMYAQRKYSQEMDYWLSLENIDKRDDDIVNKYFNLLFERTDRPLFIGNKNCDKAISDKGHISYHLSKSGNTFQIIETTYSHRDASTVKKKDKFYKIVSFKPLEMKEIEYFYSSDRVIFSSFGIDGLTTEKMNEITGLKLKDFKKEILKNVHSFELLPKDLKILSDEDREILRGRKVSYCKMNHFRHLLKEYINMIVFDSYDKKSLKERNKKAIEVFSYLDKYGDYWWF